MTDISRESVENVCRGLVLVGGEQVLPFVEITMALRTALDAAEGRVTVKPLVWLNEEDDYADVPAFGLMYLLMDPSSSDDADGWYVLEETTNTVIDADGSPEAAKAAAQADYEARILSAITLTAPSDKIAEAARLYLDLDGVMADFDAHFPSEFGLDHKSMADDDMWAKINAHPSYFEGMPLCPGAADFFAEIRHLKPIILTACPRTNYAHVAGQKRRWVRKHLGAELTVLPVMGGHNKHIFMHAPGDILIDDYEKNCAPWRKSGGVAILHTSFGATRAALRALAGKGE